MGEPSFSSVVYVNYLILLFLFGVVLGIPGPDEPICVSRYDYEHKMLHSIVKMEIEQAAQQGNIDQLNVQLKNETAVLKENMKQLQETIAIQERAIKVMATGNQQLHNILTKNLKELGETVDSQKRAIATMTAGNQKNLTQCTEQCKPGDGMDYGGYTFKDYLAQATCMALGQHSMRAVRRDCKRSAPDCTTVCKTLKRTCVNSLHVYARSNIPSTDVGKFGLKMFRYDNCGGGCGPNFCCCQG